MFNENYFYDKVDNDALDLQSQDELNFVAQDDVLENIVEELKESSPEFENVSNFETKSSLNNIFDKSYTEDDVHKDITK